jgi:glucan phosphoethanolaminetransferase (alkaline phosphatase superfamily)
MDEKPPLTPVNYCYFGAFFLLLAFMSTCSVIIKEYFIGSRIFFLLYAWGQALLEVGGFIFLAALIQKYIGKIYFWAFIGCTFFLALLHIFDFILDRILDFSTWNTLGFVVDETFDHFFYLLDASGVPMWMWFSLFLVVAALPFLGMLIYKGTDLIADKRPLFLRTELFFQLFVCIPAALFLWDFSASKLIHPDAYNALLKSLPWKSTFIQPKNVVLSLPGPIQNPPSESVVKTSLDKIEKTISKKPNIYLFIVESLRGDFIDLKTAPHLSQFRDNHIFYDGATVSNANGTHLSWFSIFHSQFSIFWKQYQKNQWSMGSPALNLLKKWGYQIRVYTSAKLGYYGMDELIFGKNLALIDSYQTFHHLPPVYAWETDQKAIHALQKDLTDDPTLQEGQVFIVFWDATHFDYSWPKNEPAQFTPFANSIAYFKTYQTEKNIELIKNSYRNAVHYVDSLFGSFWDQLPKKEESIVIVLGDHGEEFFEHGHLFHLSHLSDEQIRIPLYFKFGQNTTVHAKSIVSQMDIFPSIIDYLSGQNPDFLQGESIFCPSKWPFAMISRFNGSRTPYEFSFHNGRHKLIAQFQNKKDIFSSKSLKIKSLWNCKNQDISECKLTVESWIEDEFKGAFDRMFPQENKEKPLF